MVRPGHLVRALGTAVHNDDVRRVELAWGAAITAEYAHFVALGVFAYNEGGASAVGVAGLVRLLPAAVVSPFIAGLGDRFRRERFLLALSLLGALALAGSAAAALAGSWPLVLVSAALVGLVATQYRPALQALLPSLARTPEELVAANGATSTIEGLGTLVGPLLAGGLISVAEPALAFTVAGGTLLLASGLLLRVRVEGRIVRTTEAGERTARMLVEGFVVILRAPRTRLVVALTIAQTFVRGCLNVLIVVAAFRLLDSGAGAVGYLTASIGVGGLLGAIGAMALSGRRLAVPFGIALVFWGLPIVLIAPSTELVVAMVLLAVVGAANSVEDVAAFTLLQRLVPDEVLTRVLGVIWGLAMGGLAFGSIVAPSIVQAIGAKPAFVVVGTILPLLTLLTYRRLVAIDGALEPAAEVGLVDAVPMLAPLSLAAKEWIAGHLEPRSVRTGEVVIRAGDVGDSFYLVARGRLDVDAHGHRTSLGPGGYFGEIALLKDIPRTATVVAAEDCELRVLRREDFLAAVTGHSGARAAGQQVADARLSSDAPEAD